MEIQIRKGNLFHAQTQVIVNAVNCVGVMGKGIAWAFKLRYPMMFELYKQHCQDKQMSIGKLWLYKGNESGHWVLNFPTKVHWKDTSKVDYIEKGLQKFLDTYKNKGIRSIAFPILGTDNGGLDKQTVLDLMQKYLSQCDIEKIEIYEFDPLAPDDLFELFKMKWNLIPPTSLMAVTDITSQRQIRAITSALNDLTVTSMVALSDYAGINKKTIEDSFQSVIKSVLILDHDGIDQKANPSIRM